MILFLKERMKEKSISSIELSDKLNVSRATISYWINGKVFPTPEMIPLIADAIGVKVWQLFAPYDEIMNDCNTPTCPKCGAKLNIKIE